MGRIKPTLRPAELRLLKAQQARCPACGSGAPVDRLILICLGRDRQVMGPRLISGGLAIAGWAVAAVAGGFGALFVVGAAAGTF